MIDGDGAVVQTLANGTAAATGTASWLFGGLPPGSYTVRVYHSAAGAGSGATSDVVINAAPTIQLTSPDPASGADYATVVRSNPWHFSSAADVSSTQRISAISCDGALNGTADPALPGPGGNFDYVGGLQWTPGWSAFPGDLNGDEDDAAAGRLSTQPPPG